MESATWGCGFEPPMILGFPQRLKKRWLLRCWRLKPGTEGRRMCRPRPGPRGPRFWGRYLIHEQWAVASGQENSDCATGRPGMILLTTDHWPLILWRLTLRCCAELTWVRTSGSRWTVWANHSRRWDSIR